MRSLSLVSGSKEKCKKRKKEMLKNISEIRKLDRARLPCLRKVEKGPALVTKVIKKTKRKGEKKQFSWKKRLENQVK